MTIKQGSAVVIEGKGTELRAVTAADRQPLGGARRSVIIGSRNNTWWRIVVGPTVAETTGKDRATAELRRLAQAAIGELPAISVQLPWAAALRAGAKLIENRGRRIHSGFIGQQIAIHASGSWDRGGAADDLIRRWWWGSAERGPMQATDFSLMFGKVLSVGTLADCHQADTVDGVTCCAPWGMLSYKGQPAWHYVFKDMLPLARPVAASGSLLLPWSIPAPTATLVREQIQVPAHV